MDLEEEARKEVTCKAVEFKFKKGVRLSEHLDRLSDT